MKKQTSKLDSNAINKDFEALCKKHKLSTAALVVEQFVEKIDEDKEMVRLICGVHSTSKKKEKELMVSIKDFFMISTLNPKAIAIAASFMKEEEKRQELHLRENKLSKKDKARLLKIRSEKNECIHNSQYEKAVALRAEERKLLGYEQEPVADGDLFKAVNYELTTDNIKKLGEEIMGTLKGWTINTHEK